MRFPLLACSWFACTAALVAAPSPAISAASILARMKVLASDEFEGRAPGSAGEDKTIAFLTAEFRKLGLQPGAPGGSFLQNVPMVGITTMMRPTFASGGLMLEPQPITEFVARSRRTVPHLVVQDTEVIFCGYGVIAPEYQWDDFKGVDVRGKTIVVLINDPPVVDPKTGRLDPKVFGGKAMTYYGRWDYKYEQASALGAAACIIVHETGPAGYPFAIVGSRSGQEEFDLATPDGNAGTTAAQGWISLDFARKFFRAAGQDYAALKAAANSRAFRPVPLAALASFDVANKVRTIVSHNVVAKLPGSDTRLKDEYVVYTAHWDHLGRDPRLKGDQIFNGAFDNASGTSTLVEIAGGFAAQATPPKRTMIFLAVTGEERGLLGAKYYAEHPLYPLERTLADINMDRIQVFGLSRDLEVIGYGNSTIDDTAAAILARSQRVLVPDTQPEKGYFFRSDHFEFAKKGVPAFYTKFGKDLIGLPAGSGARLDEDYTNNDYHRVSDEVKPTWNLAGAEADANFLLELGATIANGDSWPEWKPGCEFKARREAMLRAARN